MKSFSFDFIQQFKNKFTSDKKIPTGNQWVTIDENISFKSIYIFKKNKELIISNNGLVTQASFDYLGNNCIVIKIKEDSLLLKCEYIDKEILFLKIDNIDKYFVFINEPLYDKGINSIEKVEYFLKDKYNQKVYDEERSELVGGTVSLISIIIGIITYFFNGYNYENAAYTAIGFGIGLSIIWMIINFNLKERNR